MSEHDILQQAARALRDEHDGERSGSGFTRARIMNSLHKRRKRRGTLWVTLLPVGVLFFGGSAWAAATGRLPAMLTQVVDAVVQIAPWSEPKVVVHTPPSHQTGRAGGSAAGHEPEAPRADESRPSALENTTDEAPTLLTAPEPSNEPPATPLPVAPNADKRPDIASVPALKPLSTRGKRQPERRQPDQLSAAGSRADRPKAVPTPSPTTLAANNESPPSLDAETVKFRKAHRLHFDMRNPSAAIVAYADYLRQYPNGRFAPEARYNTALNHVRLGRKTLSKQLLQPFADGRYGGYRQREAKALLKALENAAAVSR